MQATTSELATTKKQLSELQEKLALFESPEGASGSLGAKSEPKTNSADDLYKRIQAMSAS
jgi:hypothetical protein